MIRQIIHKDKIFAIIFKADTPLSTGHNFLTNEKENLQVNVINEKKGKVLEDHFHNLVKRKIIGTQEMLYVENGKMKVRFLNEEGILINQETLISGDLVVLLNGGHGFEFLEDSKIIYVKQGPYAGGEDKTNFAQISSGNHTYAKFSKENFEK